MWKRFINWYKWHGLQIVTGRKIFEKLARCQADCKELEDRFNWMAIRPVIFSLEELKKNTWDIDRVDHIQKWLRDNFEVKND